MNVKEKNIVKKLIYEVLDGQEYLYEGFIYTAPLNSVERILRQFSIAQKVPYWINKDEEHNKIQVDVIHFSDKIIKLFLSEVNNLGYFPSEIVVIYKDDPNFANSDKFSEENLNKFLKDKIEYKSIFLNFEAKFDVQLSNYPEYLYHVCRKKNLDRILKIGLIPKTKSKLSTHPERVYLTINIDGAYKIKERFENLYPNEEYALLKIKSDKIHQLRLFQDPNFKEWGGVYTLHNIHPNTIELI